MRCDHNVKLCRGHVLVRFPTRAAHSQLIESRVLRRLTLDSRFSILDSRLLVFTFLVSVFCPPVVGQCPSVRTAVLFLRLVSHRCTAPSKKLRPCKVFTSLRLRSPIIFTTGSLNAAPKAQSSLFSCASSLLQTEICACLCLVSAAFSLRHRLRIGGPNIQTKI